jgi:hypothetical protein
LQQAEVASRAEGLTCTGEHDCTSVRVGGEVVPHRGDRVMQLGIGCVQRVRTVHRDDPHRTVVRDEDRIAPGHAALRDRRAEKHRLTRIARLLCPSPLLEKR